MTIVERGMASRAKMSKRLLTMCESKEELDYAIEMGEESSKLSRYNRMWLREMYNQENRKFRSTMWSSAGGKEFQKRRKRLYHLRELRRGLRQHLKFRYGSALEPGIYVAARKIYHSKRISAYSYSNSDSWRAPIRKGDVLQFVRRDEFNNFLFLHFAPAGRQSQGEIAIALKDIDGVVVT